MFNCCTNALRNPLDNIAQKKKSEKIKNKLAERKEKRALEVKLSKVKKLADDSDDDDAAAWVAKNRKVTEERLKADKKVSEECAPFWMNRYLVDEAVRDCK